ncbi:hypothetical protein [Silvanigrella sp.]|uniref:hypothetical protein n=1 Tax=Silvanigrella sp. TaxID=2024976 RepID=UPI0037C9C6AF
MLKGKILFSIIALLPLSLNAIEIETHEIDTAYPADIRQNVINVNSYQDFDKNVGYYLDQGLYLSKFGNKYTPLLSTQLGIILNNSFSIFSGIQYSVTKTNIEYQIEETTESVIMNHYSSFNAGIGYSFFGEYFIHPKLRATFGRAYFEIENEEFKLINNFDYFSPAISAEINLWKYVTLELGIQYRYIFKASQKVADNNVEYMFHLFIGNF